MSSPRHRLSGNQRAIAHHQKMKHRRMRQIWRGEDHADRFPPDPRIPYTGAWLRAVRALRGVGRPVDLPRNRYGRSFR